MACRNGRVRALDIGLASAAPCGMSLSMKASRALLAPRAVFRLLRALDLRLILLALSLLACAALSALATPASAQQAASLPPGYTELIDEAVAEATRANFLEA